ncbi:hypothetical protein RFX70_17180, partial [Acinetobacter baumannii]|nr:hypothetical protein [Acinetobacter baumannii]
LNPEIRRLNRTVRKYWRILLRGEDRFKLYLQYEPQKEKIIDLYKSKDFEQLEIVLRDYDKAVRKNLKSNLGVFFDKDI